MSDPAAAPARPAALTVLRVAAVFTFLACAMGAVVCATKSGASCPTWPGCRRGTVTPQWALSPVIEFTHRVVAVSVGPLVLAAGILLLRRPEMARWIRVTPWLALVGAGLSGLFGRMVVVSTLPTPLAGIDLFCALAAMTGMGVAAVRAGRPLGTPGTAASPAEAAVGRLAAGGVGAVVALHVSAIFVSGTGSYTGCVGWPIWRTVSGDKQAWLQNGRLGLEAVAAVLVIATAVAAARSPRLRRWGVALLALLTGELVFGLVIRQGGIDNGRAATYSVLATALLSCLGLLAAVAGVSAPRAQGTTIDLSDRELATPGPR